MPTPLKIGDPVVLRKGTKHGMAVFKEDTLGTVDGVYEGEDGAPFYGVTWMDSKGKQRHTYTSENE